MAQKNKTFFVATHAQPNSIMLEKKQEGHCENVVVVVSSRPIRNSALKAVNKKQTGLPKLKNGSTVAMLAMVF